MTAECSCILGSQESFSNKLFEWKVAEVCWVAFPRWKDTLLTRHCIRLQRALILNAHRTKQYEFTLCFCLPLPGCRLVLYCPRHVLNSMWNVALLAPLTSLNSSWDRGQGHSPGLVFMVRWNVNSKWEKRGEVIMRHPPSAGCLFGQTGCLTVQAVDGILMHMTNDSLSPFSQSTLFFHSSLSFLPRWGWNF